MTGIEVLSKTQRVIVLPHTSVSIVKEGPTGPSGPQGPIGPPGPKGLDGDTVASNLYVPIDGEPTTVDTAVDFSTVPTVNGQPLEILTVPDTGTQTSIANSVTNVTLLAVNSNRLGATIYNDDADAVLKIKLGPVASSSSFTYAIPSFGYYEVPYGYTGVIDGIASVATGSARITELT